MTVNEVPTLLPWLNIIVSGVALLIMSYLTIRRWRIDGWCRMFLLDAMLCNAILVLLAGALFQANILSLDLWIVLGSGGRITVLIILLAVVTTPD